MSASSSCATVSACASSTHRRPRRLSGQPRPTGFRVRRRAPPAPCRRRRQRVRRGRSMLYISSSASVGCCRLECILNLVADRHRVNKLAVKAATWAISAVARRVELWDNALVLPTALVARTGVLAFGNELLDLSCLSPTSTGGARRAGASSRPACCNWPRLRCGPCCSAWPTPSRRAAQRLRAGDFLLRVGSDLAARPAARPRHAARG